jgi:hypothetical protein
MAAAVRFANSLTESLNYAALPSLKEEPRQTTITQFFAYYP